MLEFIIGYVIGFILLLIFAKLIFKSIKIVWKVIINALIGGAAIWLLNLFGVGIHVNWITALLVGFLGIPGVIVVLILQYVFSVV
jgi:inhibitor of the pro-sigma K processing machinery